MNVLKKFGIAVALYTATLAGCVSPKLDYGSMEVRSGQENSTIDTRITGSLSDDIGLFVRNISTRDNDNYVNQLSVLDVIYNLNDDPHAQYGLILEGMVTDSAQVRAGGQAYFSSDTGNDYAFLLLTGGAEPEPNLETFMIGHLGLGNDFFTEGDLTSNYGPGHNFTEGILRIGKSIEMGNGNPLEFGLYGSGLAVGEDGFENPELSGGIFARLNF